VPPGLAALVEVGPADVGQEQVRREPVDTSQLGPDADQPLGPVGVGGPGEGGLHLARLSDRDGRAVPGDQGRQRVAGGDARQVPTGQGLAVAVEERLDLGMWCGAHAPTLR